MLNFENHSEVSSNFETGYLCIVFIGSAVGMPLGAI